MEALVLLFSELEVMDDLSAPCLCVVEEPEVTRVPGSSENSSAKSFSSFRWAF